MTGRVIGVGVAALLFGALFYASRFWPFRWWDRPGLFGAEALPPQGNLVRGWLRGTEFAPFELLLWAVGAFVVLSVAQAVANRLTKR